MTGTLNFWVFGPISSTVWSLFAIAMLIIWVPSNASLLAIQAVITDEFDADPVEIVPSKLIFTILLFALF